MDTQQIAKILIPILITALLGSVITRQHKARDRFVEAYDRFKETFIPTIQTLERTSRGPGDFFAFPENFIKQETAMIAFRDNLRGKRRRLFDEKWNEYKVWQNDFMQYEMCVVNVNLHGQEFKTFILELLEIAKLH